MGILENTRGRVVLSDKGCRWLASGHLWGFSSDVVKVKDVAHGDIVSVFDRKKRFIAKAFWSEKSKMCLRILSYENTPVDAAFFAAKLKRAVERRQKMGFDEKSGIRLVFAESDFIPAFIADYYAGVLVLQSTIAAVDRVLDVLTDELCRLVNPVCVVWRLDASGRKNEQLENTVKVVRGTLPERVLIEEKGSLLAVDVLEGHKTGLYLDQRENRTGVGELCFGKVLDAFCFQGGFSVYASPHAQHITAVDMSQSAQQCIGLNLEANDIKNVTFKRLNVFDYLRECHKNGEKFDCIILDPPSFAKDKRSLAGAVRGFKEINLRAMKILNPGGRVFTFSCSHALSRSDLLDVIRAAGADSGRQFHVVREFVQSGDHPVLLSMPETSYLKGFCVQLAD